MEGILDKIWADNRKVQIDGEWYNLADFIKLEYIKEDMVGSSVSYSVADDEKKLITFIKRGFKKSNDGNKPFKPASNFKSSDVQDKITNQWAINAALKVIEIKNRLEEAESIDPTAETVKGMAEQLKKIATEI